MDNNKKKPKLIPLIIAAVCLIIAIIAIIYVIQYYMSLNKGDEIYESLQNENMQTSTIEPSTVESESTEEVTSEPESESEPEPELEEEMERVIDFEALTSETNKDIYAWISIPGTNVDYPILQHPTDDTYYLNYNLDGSKGYPGCIYTEKENAKDFSDFNTVIYGHNMKNGTMFHDLHNYEDESFLPEHSYVYIYLPDRTLKYQIFAAYQFDDRHILYSFDFVSEKGREGYLNDILKTKNMSAVLDNSVELNKDSNIITMSTCVGGQSSHRFLVQAVLIQDINK